MAPLLRLKCLLLWVIRNCHSTASLVLAPSFPVRFATGPPGYGEGAGVWALWRSGWAYLDLHRVLLGPIPIILLLALHELPEVLLDEKRGVELAYSHFVICRGANKGPEGQQDSDPGLGGGPGVDRTGLCRPPPLLPMWSAPTLRLVPTLMATVGLVQRI